MIQQREAIIKEFTFDVVTVNSQGKIIERSRGQNKYFVEDLGNEITLEMVSITDATSLQNLSVSLFFQIGIISTRKETRRPNGSSQTPIKIFPAKFKIIQNEVSRHK